MHHLEERIALWKEQIARAESLSPNDLAELEEHLRDSMADLRERGLDLDEAFLIASNRLGAKDALAIEYGKVNGSYVWRRRVFWMLAGYLVMLLVQTWIGASSSAATAIAAYGGVGGTLVGVIAVVVTCVGWAVLLIALYFLALRGLPGVSRLLSPSYGTVVALGIGGAIISAPLLALGARVLTARLVSPEMFGQQVMVTSTASLALQLLIPLICLVMMWSLRRRAYGSL
jgi:phage shock protein PspC (stress-responsive transcriptional regulator)